MVRLVALAEANGATVVAGRGVDQRRPISWTSLACIGSGEQCQPAQARLRLVEKALISGRGTVLGHPYRHGLGAGGVGAPDDPPAEPPVLINVMTAIMAEA
jgi:hypothetical protein